MFIGAFIGYFNLQNLTRGLEVMAEKHPYLLHLVLDPDEGYDAGDADAIVQLLTLGEIVYG
jgi:hypothetical protein